jgi:bacillolysin
MFLPSRRLPVWQYACAVVAAITGAIVWLVPAAAQQPRAGLLTIAALSDGPAGALREWSSRIDTMRRSGDLRLRTARDDLLVRGRRHDRYDQYYRGVRVFGADVAQQLNGGQVVSMFGNLYENIAIDPSPTVSPARAREIAAERAGVELSPSLEPELVILPRESGDYTLTWRLRAAGSSDIRQYFIDARSQDIVREYSDRQTQRQSGVGRAQGVLGDSKKISVSVGGGRFQASDLLRPPAITTYDMRSNVQRVEDFLNGLLTLNDNDIASDSDNAWTDGAVADAHVYAGWTYDYFFKRFNRRGLDNNNRAVQILVHPIDRNTWQTQFDTFPEYFTNAFYAGNGIMVFGDGLPASVTLGGQTWDFVAGGLDIVAHELTHGVTDYSSNLIYQNESGALNESFSDVMGTSVEFFFQPAGSASMRADYLIAEDVVRVGGIRSMSDPQALGDPDHYSRRFMGSGDNGGVHINSGIPNQAFYLAIEGGANRTSGLPVQGVGAANREQIERVFYRAFTQMLPANATFSIARAATIQAARDLFSANSAAERAVTQAWAAVGVN